MTAPVTPAQQEHRAYAGRDPYLTSSSVGLVTDPVPSSSRPMAVARARTGATGRRVGRAIIGLVSTTAVGVLVWMSVPSGPGSPREAVDAYFTALQTDDHGSAYDLMCPFSQLMLGSRSQFIEGMHLERSRDLGQPDFGFTIGNVSTLGEPYPYETPVQRYRVAVLIERGGSATLEEVTIAKMDGEYRVCG